MFWYSVDGRTWETAVVGKLNHLCFSFTYDIQLSNSSHFKTWDQDQADGWSCYGFQRDMGLCDRRRIVNRDTADEAVLIHVFDSTWATTIKPTVVRRPLNLYRKFPDSEATTTLDVFFTERPCGTLYLSFKAILKYWAAATPCRLLTREILVQMVRHPSRNPQV